MIDYERSKFEEEKKMMTSKFGTDKKVFQLNVRGETQGFLLSKHLLCSVEGTALEAKFSGRHALVENEKGEYYVDRDPKAF